MKMPTMKKVNIQLPMILLLLSSLNIQAYADDVVTAKWQAYQIRFNYSGFTTNYTCDGIEYKVKRLLLALGARDDVRVEASCTSFLRETQRFHKLLLAFALPVEADESDITEETFAAKWERVQLRRNRPRELEPGDCELVEQFNRQVLRKINAKEIVDKNRCIPNRHLFNSPNLSMTLLIRQPEQELEPEKK